VTLEYAVTKAIVGLPAVARIKSLKLAFGGSGGSAIGEPKRASAVTLLVHRTPRGAFKVGRGWDYLDRVADHLAAATMDRGPPIVTDEVRAPFDGENAGDPRIHIECDGAGPATLLGMVVHMETGAS
jgi:hypothetical protein